MTFCYRSTAAMLVLILPALAASIAAAADPYCDQCGCHSQVKKMLRLVVVWEDAEVPTYACRPLNVFHPDKGMVCRPEYRCETVCKRVEDCKDSQTLCCEETCECRTAYGAKSTGRHNVCCVRQPDGSCKYVMPVLKWRAIDCCPHCQRPVN